MKTTMLLLLLFGCVKKQAPVEVPADFKGKICAYGLVIMVDGNEIRSVFNPDGSAEKCSM